MNRSQLTGAMNNLTTHDLLSYRQKLSPEENVAEVAQGVTRLLLENVAHIVVVQTTTKN